VNEEREAKNSEQEARDQQRGERFRKTDEDGGVGASHQGSQGEGRKELNPTLTRAGLVGLPGTGMGQGWI
jgi:hypothetical protein